MKSSNRQLYTFLASVVLLCGNSVGVYAQTLTGKWLVQGKEQALHFSAEGAFVHEFAETDAAFGVWYMEDESLAIVYMEDETLVGFNVLQLSEKSAILENMNDNSRVTLKYLGGHEIPGDYVSLVADNFGDDAGYQRVPGKDPVEVVRKDTGAGPGSEIDARSGTIDDPAPLFVIDPGNLSLVGCWTDDRGISDPMVFDERGFYKKGSFEGDYIYEDLGLYHFDGQTLTVHFFKSVMNYSAGDIVSFEISNLTSNGLTINLGDGYSANYSRNDTYGITQANRNEIQAQVNHKALENTWWQAGRTQYLFLTPDLVITREGGESDFQRFAFEGNELRFQEIDANAKSESFGKVTAWNDTTIVLSSTSGVRTLQSGKGYTDLSANESHYYRNYVSATQNLRIQALLGIGEGMDIIEVEWKD